MSSNDNDPKFFDINNKTNWDKDLNNNNLKSDDLDNNDIKKNFIDIKSSTSEINQDIKKNILEASLLIQNKENEIKSKNY